LKKNKRLHSMIMPPDLTGIGGQRKDPESARFANSGSHFLTN